MFKIGLHYYFLRIKIRKKTENPNEFVFRPKNYRIKLKFDKNRSNAWVEYKIINFKGTLFSLTNKICNELYTNPIADSSMHLQLKVIKYKMSFYFFLQSEGPFFIISS